MTRLQKASLKVLGRSGDEEASFDVQFNPATLQLQMTNSIDGGKSRGRQTQQYNGSSSTQLSVDLEFDTADEGAPNAPVDVRTRTNSVRTFVLPGGERSKQAPPRVKFEWGTFELVGVMNSLTEELSLFSPEGAPLRSKLSVQIKEQDPAFAALETGPGANADNSPPASGDGDGDVAGPGSSGGGPVDRVSDVLDGETPADFLARNGADPAAWRALGSALEAVGDGIELQAGVGIGFDASLSLGLGVGVTAGLHGGIGSSVGAALGLTGGATGAGLAQGFALAAAGGATAAAEAAQAAEADAGARAARSSFGAGVPSAAAAASGGVESAPRAPLGASSGARTQPAAPSGSAAAPLRADRRATSYGRGVPLRDRVGVPGAEPDGYVVLGRSSSVAASSAPSASAPWERLGPSAARRAADREQGDRRPDCGCRRCDPWAGGVGSSGARRSCGGGCGG